MSDIKLLELIRETVENTMEKVVLEEQEPIQEKLDLRNDPWTAKYLSLIQSAKGEEELYSIINEMTLHIYQQGVNFGLHMAQRVVGDYAQSKKAK